MKRYKKQQKVREHMKTMLTVLLVTTAVIAAAVVLLIINNNSMFQYERSLDKTVLIVQGEEVKLKELSYYFMIEEESVNETALTYDPENPRAYWNLYINSTFVSVAARDTAIDYFLRDRLYYRLAMEEGMGLTEEEWEEVYRRADAMVTDMTPKQQRLGMTEEDLIIALEKHQMADNYVLKHAKEQELTMSEEVLSAYFGLNSPFFKEQKQKAEVKYKDRILDKIRLGNLTIN